MLARVQLQPGAPWGGAGSILGAAHEMALARKGQSVAKHPHQRAWALGMRKPQALAEEPQVGASASPDACRSEATLQRCHLEGAPVADRRLGSAVSLAPDHESHGLAALIMASAATPAAGRPVAEVSTPKWRPAPAKGPIDMAKMPGKLDSAGFITQLESPAEVPNRPSPALLPPRLEKTAYDEMRADHSAAEQVRRGKVQSAFQPGTQPTPYPPEWAVQRPRTAHPRGAPEFQDRLWPCARSEHNHMGRTVSRAWSGSPRWAPIRCGQSVVRLQRVSVLHGGDSQVPLPPQTKRQPRQQPPQCSRVPRPPTSASHSAGVLDQDSSDVGAGTGVAAEESVARSGAHAQGGCSRAEPLQLRTLQTRDSP